MNDNEQEQMRERIIAFLPAALEKAFAEYHAFMASAEEASKSKDFAAKQSAAKAAIAHILLLVKLWEWAVKDGKSYTNDDYSASLTAAKREVEEADNHDQDLA